MTGQELKTKLQATGKSQKEISDLLQIRPQSLNTIYSSQDVKTGTIEKLCTVLGVPMSFFYPEGTTLTNQYVNRAKNVTQTGDIKDTDNKTLQTLLEQNSQLIKIIQQNMTKE